MSELNLQLVALIETMNDKPIAFNRHYVALGCGINGALMLSQMVYWSKRTKDRNGSFYKTQDEWEEETGLGRREQETARKKLRELGFVSEHKRGVPCKVHFKVEHDVLYKALIKLAQNRQSSMAESAKLECTNQPNSNGGNSQSNTENTAETTNKNKDKGDQKKSAPNKQPLFDAKAIELPVNVNRDLWIQFVDMRNSIRKPLTENAVNLLIKKLVGFGDQANQSLEASIIGSYQSVYPPKQQTSVQNQQPMQRRRFGNQADPNQMRTVGESN